MADSHTTEHTPARATVQLDTDFTRVTEWYFTPGTHTTFHVHEWDYVVVPTVPGTMTIETADEVFDNPIELGASYTRSAGSAHDVRNDTDSDFAFVEIEFKGRGIPT
ncbi:cupin [Brevibacterium litoralis]|uniref:cupin n=1 Tax=Brevibacterium litoralis TaxID=3138935 RepID=UPI0032EB5FDC